MSISFLTNRRLEIIKTTAGQKKSNIDKLISCILSKFELNILTKYFFHPKNENNRYKKKILSYEFLFVHKNEKKRIYSYFFFPFEIKSLNNNRFDLSIWICLRANSVRNDVSHKRQKKASGPFYRFNLQLMQICVVNQWIWILIEKQGSHLFN